MKEVVIEMIPSVSKPPEVLDVEDDDDKIYETR